MAAGKRKSRKSSNVSGGSTEAALPLPLTATTRALSIPEILIGVLSLCKNADLGRAALTCRRWSPVALDYLWKELDSIVPLLVLVQPLRLACDTEEKKIWEFEGSVADADWVRFREYARRIRSLEFNENDDILGERGSFIAFSAIHTLAVVHPFGPSLLPNLQELYWCCTRDDTVLSILPFMSSSLLSLELDIEKTVSGQNFQRLLRSLSHRIPNLEHFLLSTAHPVTTINEPLAHLLNSAPELRNATLPQFFHTPEILASLGRLQQLKKLGTDWVYSKTDYVERGTSLLFPNDSYPALKTLHFHSSLALATRLFRSPGPVSQLKEVCFSTRKCYPFKALKVFLSTLTRTCPQLEVLLLNFATVIVQDDTPNGPLTLDEFRPCLSLVHLRKLNVAYDYPFVLRDADVWEISRAWKKLRALRLCSDPEPVYARENASTPITILKTFSVAIPTLKYLSLYFDEDEVPQFEPDLGLEGGFTGPFELDVGFSAVPGDDEHAVGFFLGSLCRQNPTISTSQTYWTEWSKPARKEEDEKWDRVQELARMICRTKIGVNAKIQTLISRIETLEGMITSNPAT
ncbi:hypothetical protein FS837_001507 [Tulasnella sp. UAMH 9824]|nr:hypothetical protein FS837_001507 [Tulasnella sp. UAMH 9824]